MLLRTRLLLACACAVFVLRAASFDRLPQGTVVEGFRSVALYDDDAGKPFGARFLHEKTGFTLDLIQIQSAPQSFIWVTTYPTSEQGEPHTQEHLLLGKGNKGRALAAGEDMSLTEMSAFTDQWRTCYHLNTTAGVPVFYEQFHNMLDALLHPDYTDEEIRREVRNFGVSEVPGQKTLTLQEKGSVYNEMISTSNNPGWIAYRQLIQDVYGVHHPLAYNSGGEPSGIRTLQPADIRKFHHDHYFLANMGAIVSLPKGETLEAMLHQIGDILNQVEPERPNLPVETEASLPAPAPAPAGHTDVKEFPFANDQQPGVIGLVWPADRRLSSRDRLLTELFFDNFAGDETSNLYRLFINSKTRQLNIGAQSISSHVSADQGHPIGIIFGQVRASSLNEKTITAVRDLVDKELARIAAWPDGSPELAEFNDRIRGRVIEERRDLDKLVNSPPKFGFRGTYQTWLLHFDRLNEELGYRKSVTLRPDLEAVERMLGPVTAGPTRQEKEAGRAFEQKQVNIWRDLLVRLKITGVVPWGDAARPSPALLKQQNEERQQRVDAEVRRLEAKYGVTDGQQAIHDYQKDYDAETAKLDALATNTATHFLDQPPLTLDDQLDYRVAKVGAVPLVASTFDTMTSSTTALALRINGLRGRDLVLVSLLPELLTATGVIENGKPVSYEEMQDRLRREILSLNAGFITGDGTPRVELLLTGAGDNIAESRRAVEWMRLVLNHPDWSSANLPRIRDLVDQLLSQLRTRMQGAEESWVRDPAEAYHKQTNQSYLAAASFLTRAYNADRLRWMLRDTGSPGDRAAFEQFLGDLAGEGANKDRDALKSLLGAAPSKAASLPVVAKQNAAAAALDLEQLLSDLPDRTLAADFQFLCRQIRADVEIGPQTTLSRLDDLRSRLLRKSAARMWMVGSAASQQQLQPSIAALLADLADGPSTAPEAVPSARLVDERLREHEPLAASPHFIGLIDPNMVGGVMMNRVPFPTYHDTSRDAVLDVLAAGLFAGAGAHAIFTKTIGVGLAYSNGVGYNLGEGALDYYAERMPEIPQTLHFAIDVVKHGPRDPKLFDYMVANVFRHEMGADDYENRAQAIADEIEDGNPPEVVRAFRESVQQIRHDPQAPAEALSRVDTVYGKLLPGYGPKAKDVPGAIYYIIGADRQFKALDAEVQNREDEHVWRLYPRDYWLVSN